MYENESSMKIPSLILLALLLPGGCGNRTDGPADADAGPRIASEAESASRKVALADPFILLWNGRYYAYGTGARDGIAVLESDDLLHWRAGVGKAAGGLALHKDDVWGGKNFWAPEVYRVGDRFCMFFTAESHVCAATSSSPLGPFVQQVRQPIIADECCIDNTLFTDDDGRHYMYYDRFNDGNNIWVAELEPDLRRLRPGTERKCLCVSQPWERRMGRVVEGCCVIKHNGIYYMTYSANDYRSPFYGIGCATAPSPLGPWVKYDHNPLLQRPGELQGVGHGSLFRDKAGKLRIVFHAHHGAGRIHPRCMYLSDVRFRYRKGRFLMEIAPDYVTPVLE